MERFTIEGKAGVTEGDDGTLYLRGLAATFSKDLDDEAFDRHALDDSLKQYLNGTAPILHHHRGADLLGRCLSAEVTDDGVEIVAEIYPQPESSPLRWVYDHLRRANSSLSGLSIGGYFERAWDAVRKMQRIVRATVLEISISPTPRGVYAGKGTRFELIPNPAAARKAGLIADFQDEARRRIDLVGLRLDAKALDDRRRERAVDRLDAVQARLSLALSVALARAARA